MATVKKTKSVVSKRTPKEPLPVSQPKPKPKPKPKKSSVDWSPFQMAVFRFLVNKTQSLVVQAVAGSGKTETAIKGIQLMASRGQEDMLFLAFNKKIKQHAQAKLEAKGVPEYICSAKTFNSIGHSFLMRKFNRPRLDDGKLWQVIEERFPRIFKNGEVMEDFEIEKFQRHQRREMDKVKIRSIVQYIRQLGFFIDTKYDVDAYARLIAERWPVIFEDEAISQTPSMAVVEKFAKASAIIMQLMDTRTDIVDFVDQVRLPLVHKMIGRNFPYQTVIVDECQDVSPYQLLFIETLIKNDVRIIAIGDSAQSIYGFRGATADAMNKIVAATQAEQLPLSITYRCPANITEYVNQVVADSLGSHLIPHRRGGKVVVLDIYDRESPYHKDSKEFRQESVWYCVQHVIKHKCDMVISAYNSHLFAMFLGLFSQGVKSSLKGTGIIERMRKLIRSLEKREGDWDKMLTLVKEYLEKEENSYKSPSQYDQIYTLYYVIDNLEITSWEALDQKIDEIDAQDTTGIQLHTVHSSKGLEADNVYLINLFFKSKNTEDQTDNLKYVAMTRATKLLVIG